MNIIAQFKSARRVSAPLIAIQGPDHSATITGILASYGDSQPPAVRWDCVNGLTAVNAEGRLALQALGEIDGTANPISALVVAHRLPGKQDGNKGAILFAVNLHMFSGDPTVIQAVWNLRDAYKVDMRTLVILAPSIKLPPELTNDVLVLDEPLPTETQIGEIVTRMHKDAGQKVPDVGTFRKIIDATSGLAAFPAEQTIAMALQKDGTISVSDLWERKKQSVEQTPGLKAWQGGERFRDIGGLENIKGFLTKLIGGKMSPRVIVFIDEIEKQLAGIGGDSSGTSQDQLGTILSFMQNERAQGILLYGPAGTGKSNIAKATGNEAGVPTIELDFGGMKHENVGGSEARIRSALKVVKAIGQDRLLFIATCNSMANLPPELRRRFKSGTFFMDLPNETERLAIWDLFMGRLSVKKQKMPSSAQWTGAEIQQCCEYAESFGVSLLQASQYIVPVAVSASEVVQGLRKSASGKFISASYAGMYIYEPSSEESFPGIPKRMISEE